MASIRIPQLLIYFSLFLTHGIFIMQEIIMLTSSCSYMFFSFPPVQHLFCKRPVVASQRLTWSRSNLQPITATVTHLHRITEACLLGRVPPSRCTPTTIMVVRLTLPRALPKSRTQSACARCHPAKMMLWRRSTVTSVAFMDRVQLSCTAKHLGAVILIKVIIPSDFSLFFSSLNIL